MLQLQDVQTTIGKVSNYKQCYTNAGLVWGISPAAFFRAFTWSVSTEAVQGMLSASQEFALAMSTLGHQWGQFTSFDLLSLLHALSGAFKFPDTHPYIINGAVV